MVCLLKSDRPLVRYISTEVQNPFNGGAMDKKRRSQRARSAGDLFRYMDGTVQV